MTLTEINPQDYFSASLLNGLVGKVSSDRKKIWFGGYFVNFDLDLISSFDVDEGKQTEVSSEADTKEWDLLLVPSAEVSATILTQFGQNGELYWLLCIMVELPKKMQSKDCKRKVMVLGCGTVD